MKRKLLVLFLSLFVIISTASYAFFQIKQNHEANMLLIDECLSTEGTVTVETNILKISTVACEQN